MGHEIESEVGDRTGVILYEIGHCGSRNRKRGWRQGSFFRS